MQNLQFWEMSNVGNSMSKNILFLCVHFNKTFETFKIIMFKNLPCVSELSKLNPIEILLVVIVLKL